MYKSGEQTLSGSKHIFFYRLFPLNLDFLINRLAGRKHVFRLSYRLCSFRRYRRPEHTDLFRDNKTKVHINLRSSVYCAADLPHCSPLLLSHSKAHIMSLVYARLPLRGCKKYKKMLFNFQYMDFRQIFHQRMAFKRCMTWQKVQAQIRLLLKKQSVLSLHCLLHLTTTKPKDNHCS